MTNTGLAEFDNTIQKTNKLLNEIESALGWENRRSQSYAALRAVLHTLRDRLLPNEAVQLGAQLPVLIRGMYYEDWKPARTPKRMDQAQFLEAIRMKFPFSIKYDIESVAEVVLTALRKHISRGEAQDIVATLPKDVAQIVNQLL